MPMGRYPERVKDFRKWSQDQIDRGSVAGNKVTSSRGRKWRLSRKRRKKKRNKDG